MKHTSSFTVVLFVFSLTALLWAQQPIEAAKTAMKNKNWPEAQKILQEIIDRDEANAGAYYLLGECFIALKEYEEAGDAFEEATERAPDSALYHFRYGQALGMEAQNSGMLTKALLAPKIKSAFERAVELDSTLAPARVSLANFYMMAPGFMGGDVDKAREQARALIRMGDINGRLILANIYLQDEKSDSALIEFTKLEKEVGDNPKYYEFYNTYGYLLLRQKQYEQAIEKFKKQIELAPGLANPYDSLGDAYRAAGKTEEAKAQYKKALEIDPTFEASRDKLEELEE